MKLGKALFGAIVGAVIGIGILLVIYRLFEVDGFWLAIPFAIITGLGVRMLVNTTGNVSYLRGALTMILALAAYISGWFLVAQMATARAHLLKAPASIAAVTHDEEPGATDAADAAIREDTAPTVEARKPAETVNEIKRTSLGQGPWSTWGFIWLGIAALVAYQMGRGSDVTGTHALEPAEQNPAGTHPDA